MGRIFLDFFMISWGKGCIHRRCRVVSEFGAFLEATCTFVFLGKFDDGWNARYPERLWRFKAHFRIAYVLNLDTSLPFLCTFEYQSACECEYYI